MLEFPQKFTLAMALVTVQRSPTPSNSAEEDIQRDDAIIQKNLDENDAFSEHCDSQRSLKSSAGKQRSLTSECYFAIRSAAVALSQHDCIIMMPKSSNSAGGEIQLHLQAMLHLLRTQDTLKMAVRLESIFDQHTRYMAIVSTTGRQDNHESMLLGVDYAPKNNLALQQEGQSNVNHSATIGLTIPIWASTCIALDGDGGIVIDSSGSHYVFKPVSVQAMWSAFQCLHKEHEFARSPYPYFPGGLTHTWTQYYEARINSKEVFRSEWHYVCSDEDHDELKADSLQRFKEKPPERAATEKLIRSTLKNIMQSVDLDEVTSKDIRKRLEDTLSMNLCHYKEFVDQEMLIILGQMDKPSQIFPYLYLGTEWNASNWDELKQNNVSYILNVTKEVDNFFPGMFNYMKIRVSDVESTELLKHWDSTHRFIRKARENNSAVLVHCKKGISRSSSTVISYAMKAYGWSLDEALNYVKEKRNCITPNKGFMVQLRTYQGILEASQHRNSHLFRTKQNTCMSPELVPWNGLPDMGVTSDAEDQMCVETTMISTLQPQQQQQRVLIAASENIVKSAPSEDMTLDSEVEASPVRFQLCFESASDSPPKNLNDDELPDIQARLSMRRRLKNVEQRATCGSLRNVQKLLVKRSTGSLTDSSSAGDTSSNGSSSMTATSSGDEEDHDSTAANRKRNDSKSSSGGDSAVADLRPDSVKPATVTFRRCFTSSGTAESQQSTSDAPARLARPVSYTDNCVPEGRVKLVTRHYEMSCSVVPVEPKEPTSNNCKPKIVSNVKKTSLIGLPIAPLSSSTIIKKPTISAGRKLFDKFFARRDSDASPSTVATPKFQTQWYDKASGYSNPTMSKTDRLPRRILQSYRCFWADNNESAKGATTPSVVKWRHKTRCNKTVWSLVDVFEQSAPSSSKILSLEEKRQANRSVYCSRHCHTKDKANSVAFRRVESIANIHVSSLDGK